MGKNMVGRNIMEVYFHPTYTISNENSWSLEFINKKQHISFMLKL
jgi:hypothetical protein